LLEASPAQDRDRALILVTDGQVGNEDQVLRDLAVELASVRVHTVGIDRAVNALQKIGASERAAEETGTEGSGDVKPPGEIPVPALGTVPYRWLADPAGSSSR
jgi:hypothetical protein